MLNFTPIFMPMPVSGGGGSTWVDVVLLLVFGYHLLFVTIVLTSFTPEKGREMFYLLTLRPYVAIIKVIWYYIKNF